MYRYLCYNSKYEKEGDVPPELVFSDFLIDNEQDIIGLRFKDEIAGNVWIDIPVDKLFHSSDYIKIKKHVEKACKAKAKTQISLIRDGKTILKYKENREGLVTLKSDFRLIRPKENIVSFYLPKCVIRYKSEKFYTEEYKKLDMLALFIMRCVCRDYRMKVEYLRFINVDEPFMKIKNPPSFLHRREKFDLNMLNMIRNRINEWDEINSETSWSRLGPEEREDMLDNVEKWNKIIEENLDIKFVATDKNYGFFAYSRAADNNFIYNINEFLDKFYFSNGGCSCSHGSEKLAIVLPFVEHSYRGHMYWGNDFFKALKKRRKKWWPLLYRNRSKSNFEYMCLMTYQTHKLFRRPFIRLPWITYDPIRSSKWEVWEA